MIRIKDEMPAAGKVPSALILKEIVIPRWSVPRVHPNGPIQLDLSADKRTRLHVWLREPVAGQKVHTPIHDHVFGYRSSVLVGGLVSEEYVFLPDPSHAEYVRHCAVAFEGEETKLVPFGEPGRIVKTGRMETWAGRSYVWPAYVLHWAFPLTPTAVTLMEKRPGAESCIPAVVIVPAGQAPDNDFRRDDYPPSKLWPIIAEALRLGKIGWGFGD